MADIMPPMTPPAPVPPWPPTPLQKAWGNKHALATAALALAVFGPWIIQKWPEAAQPLEQLKQYLPPPEFPQAQSPYETMLRYAYSQEDDPGKADSLKALLFLYRRTQMEALTQWQTQADLQASFMIEETKLSLQGKLPKLRAVVRAAWLQQVPQEQFLTEPARVKITLLLATTLKALERL